VIEPNPAFAPFHTLFRKPGQTDAAPMPRTGQPHPVFTLVL